VKIVSPTARENPNLGTEFPGRNRRAAVVECRTCALSAAGKPQFGRGGYDQSIWPFLCEACEGRAVHNGGAVSFCDIRATSDSDQTGVSQ